MANYAWNAVVVEGNKEAYDLVKSALTGEGENVAFDFSKIMPLPQYMDKFSSPVKVVPDEEFEQYMQENHPEGLDAYAENGLGLQQVPQSLYDKWIEESGSGDWYDFRTTHWGTKWNGWDVQIADDKEAESTIAVIFATAWSAPMGIYKALEERFSGCRVHAGAIYEDGMEAEFIMGDEDLFYDKFELGEEEVDLGDGDYYTNRWWG